MDGSFASVQLLDFWSPTCGPCKSLEPHLNAFEEANKGIVEVVNINTKDPSNAQLKQKYRIRAVPTMVLLRDGVVHCLHLILKGGEAVLERPQTLLQARSARLGFRLPSFTLGVLLFDPR